MVAKRADAECPDSSRFGIGLRNRCRDLVHVGLCLLERSARLQAGDALQIDADAAPSDPFVRRDDIRNPEISRAQRADRVRHLRRHDAEDLVGGAFQRNRSADDIGTRAKALAPKGVTHDGHAMSSFDFAVGRENTANGRPNAEDVKETGRHTERDHILRWRAGRLEREFPVGNRGQ